MQGTKREGSSRSSRLPRAFGVFGLVFGFTLETQARPGIHPVVVSTWDARASSVVLGYRHGSFDGGALNLVSYHANFSSTGGKLSSQFGFYYLNLSREASEPTAHGLSGSATAVFNLPVTRRLDNGLPVTAVDFYVGSAPTALISGQRNYLTLPLALGFGLPITPAKVITLTPWLEFSPSVNLDTEIREFHVGPENANDYVTVNPMTGQVSVDFTPSDVEDLIGRTVDLRASAAVGARAGLDLALHASDSFDFTANAGLSSFGSAFSGTGVLYLGGGLVWRWDDIVLAVLPAEKRLRQESCEDVELRFRSCPNSKQWRSPEEVERRFGPQPVPAIPLPPPPAPVVPVVPSSSGAAPAVPAAPPPSEAALAVPAAPPPSEAAPAVPAIPLPPPPAPVVPVVAPPSEAAPAVPATD